MALCTGRVAKAARLGESSCVHQAPFALRCVTSRSNVHSSPSGHVLAATPVARVVRCRSSRRQHTSVLVRAEVAYPFKKKDARLVLEDGSVWKGCAFGAKGTEIGEVVFNTSITGYQEIMTDPSYKGQFVCFTHPHIGNVGINAGKAMLKRLYNSKNMLTGALPACWLCRRRGVYKVPSGSYYRP